MKEDNNHGEGVLPDGHLDENWIAAYAEHLKGWTPAPPAYVTEHTGSCSRCRSAVMEAVDMLDDMEQMRLEEPPASYTRLQPGKGRIVRPASEWKGVLRAVAGIAAVAILAWFIQFLIPERGDDPPVTGIEQPETNPPVVPDSSNNRLPDGEDTLIEQPMPEPAVLHDTIRFAEAFVPNPALEALTRPRYRNITDPVVVGPRSDTLFTPGEQLVISYSIDPVENCTVVLVDNKGKEIQRFAILDNGIFEWEIDLLPGLYYWQFEGIEEVYIAGPIRVVSQR